MLKLSHFRSTTLSVSLTVLLWNSITTKTLISQTGLRISLWKFQKTLPIHKPVKIGLKEAVLDDAIFLEF